jgi:hypothetical protein
MIQMTRKKSWAALGLLGGFGLIGLARIPGVVQGFGTLRKDGIVDAALVVPSLTPQQILTFELDDLLAPDENLSAGPMDTKVPGNVFVPEQSENYGIFPITIVKNEFGYYPKETTTTELATYWARAPFSDLVAKIREKAPYKEIIELVSFKKFGLTEKTDWSRVSKITTKLDRAPVVLGPYTWKRAAASKSEVDLVVTFHETPHKNWMLGGLDTKPKASGQVNGIEGQVLVGLTKAFFLRITNDANNKPVGGRGYFRNHSSQRAGDFAVEGVPGLIPDLKLENRALVRWTKPEVEGWVGIFKTKKSKGMNLFFDRDSEEDDSELGLQAKVNEQWVPAEAQSFELAEPLKETEELLVVFVGSPVNLAIPTQTEMGSRSLQPLLETATELRLQRIK